MDNQRVQYILVFQNVSCPNPSGINTDAPGADDSSVPEEESACAAVSVGKEVQRVESILRSDLFNSLSVISISDHPLRKERTRKSLPVQPASLDPTRALQATTRVSWRMLMLLRIGRFY